MKDLQTYLIEKLKINKNFVFDNEENEIIEKLINDPTMQDQVYKSVKIDLFEVLKSILYSFHGTRFTSKNYNKMVDKIFSRFYYLPTNIYSTNYEIAVLKESYNSSNLKNKYDDEMYELYSLLKNPSKDSKFTTSTYEYFKGAIGSKYKDMLLSMSEEYMIMIFPEDMENSKLISAMFIVKFKLNS